MEQPQTWRTFLAALKATKRNELAKALDINLSTLSRWLKSDNGTQTPRASIIRKMESLAPTLFAPQDVPVFLELLRQEFPLNEEVSSEIPRVFYEKILTTNVDVIPQHRLWTITNLLFQQMRQLDPNALGLRLDLFQCLPTDNMVYSLVKLSQEDVGLQTSSNHLWFCGIESLIGQAVQTCQPKILEAVEAPEAELFTRVRGVTCVGAFPIHRGGEVAGGLLLYATSAYFFQVHFRLLEKYLRLFPLAFSQFFPPNQIQLQSFPSGSRQTTSLQSYRQRVTNYVTQGLYPLVKAEIQALCDIQQEILEKERHERE